MEHPLQILHAGQPPDQAPQRSRFGRYLLWLLPLAGLGVVVFYVHELGLRRLVLALRDAGWGLPIILALPLFLFVVHAIGWGFTLSRENRRAIGWLRLSALQTFSYGVSGMLPLQAFISEPLKLAFLKGTDFDKEDFAGSLLIDNTINGISIFLVGAAGMFYLAFFVVVDRWAQAAVAGLTVVVLLAFAVLIVAQSRGVFSFALALLARVRVTRGFAARNRERARRVDDSVGDFYAHNRRGFFLALFFHVVEKAHGVVELWLIFRVLGMELSWGTCFFVFSVVSTLDNVLFFLQLGGMEAWMSSLLAWLDVTRDSIHISAALFRRIRFLFWALVAVLLVPATRNLLLRRRARAGLGVSVTPANHR